MTKTERTVQLVGGALCGVSVEWPYNSDLASMKVGDVIYTYHLVLSPVDLTKYARIVSQVHDPE